MAKTQACRKATNSSSAVTLRLMIGETRNQHCRSGTIPSAIFSCYLPDGPSQNMELSVANNDGKWTEWWWLAFFGLRTWTFEERKARIALGMTTMVAFLVIHFPLATLLKFGIERHYAAVLSGIVSVVLGFFVARPIAAIIFPDALRRADKNSQRRLRGRATRSTALQFSSTVLSFVLAGPPISLATLFVLLVPVVPFLLFLDTHVRQRAEDAVWESASGHARPYAGPVPFVDVRVSRKSADLALPPETGIVGGDRHASNVPKATSGITRTRPPTKAA